AFHERHVVRGRDAQAFELVGVERAHPLRRAPEHEGAGRDDGARCQERAGADQALGPDDDGVEHDRPDADETAILDGASAEHGGVPQGDPVAHERRQTAADDVHGGVVLQVAARPDAHVVDVAAHHGVEPEARLRADDDVADHDRGVGNVRRRVDARALASEGDDHGRAKLLLWTRGGESCTPPIDRPTEEGTVTPDGHLVADSDMHIFEPPDLWQRYIDPAWRHVAPVGLAEMQRDMRVRVKSHVLLRLGSVRPLGARSAWKEEHEGPYAHAERQGWNPASQKEAMDAEGLDLAVLFPTRGLFVLGLDTPAMVGPDGLGP